MAKHNDNLILKIINSLFVFLLKVFYFDFGPHLAMLRDHMTLWDLSDRTQVSYAHGKHPPHAIYYCFGPESLQYFICVFEMQVSG